MKTAINHKRLFQLTLCFVLMSGAFANAQVLDAFTPRFNENVNGGVTIIANNMLSRTATFNYNGSNGNHDYNDNVYVDIDGDPTTFNSSSANFSNPEPQLECLGIKKALLYWAAADKEPSENEDNQPSWNYNNVKLMLPGQSNYTTITADETIYRGRDFHIDNDPYICVKDITDDIVNLSDPYGTYQVANVEAKIGELESHGGGNTGTSGGWQIVFIYESPKLPTKNISLFDGYAHVTSSTNNFNIDFNGFQTAPTGSVNAKVIIGALEGDRDLNGDKLQIRNTANNFVDLSAPMRGSNNFFNSRITVGDYDYTDRNPVSRNTLGFDAAVFKLNNSNNSIIGNNQSSATIRLTSDRETYGLYLIGLAIDVWAPNLNPIHVSLESGTNPVTPGGTLELGFDVINKGNDDAKNLSISTTLPPQVANVNVASLPNGVTYNFNSSTGLLNFDFTDGLMDIDSSELSIDFDLVIQDACYFLEENCDLSFDLQFVADYNGIENPNAQQTMSSAGLNPCNIGNLQPLNISIVQPSVAWATPAGDLDTNINCGDTNALNAAQSLVPETDNCDFTLTKTSGDFVEDPNCPLMGTYTNTFAFTDACGVTISEYTQVITVGGATSLSFNETLPSDITAECDDVPTADILTANANCGFATVTMDETTTAGSCDGNYTIIRTWTATDDCGNTISHTQTVTVEDTTGPTFNESLPANVTVECDAVPNAQTLTADDNCGDASVAYNEAVTPGSCDNSYTITRVWNATDECGNITTHNQIITVQDTTSPILSNLPLSVDNSSCLQTFENRDFELNTSVNSWAYLNENSVAGWSTTASTNTIEIQESGSINNVSSYSGNYHAELNGDMYGDLYQEFCTIPLSTLNISFAHHKRMQSSNTTDDIMAVYVGADLNNLILLGNFTATSTSGWQIHNVMYEVPANQVNSVFVFRAIQGAPGNTTLGNLIDNITIEAASHPSTNSDITVECDSIPDAPTVTATDNCGTATVSLNETTTAGTCDNEYTITRVWTATDACGNTTNHTQNITVQDTTAPTFNETLPTDVTTECDNVPTPEVLTASDNCGDATVTMNETITAGACDGEYTVSRTWTATDACGNTANHTQTITVQDTTEPTFNETLPTDITTECDSVPTPEVLTASDSCGEAVVTLNETTTAGSCANEYTITRIWTATDTCGNTTTHTQTVAVVDTTAPTFTVPADVNIECNKDPDDLGFTGDVTDEMDNCDTNLEATYTDVITDGICVNVFTITRTWSLSDSCGNTTELVQTIYVIDTINPYFTVPDDITIECDQDPNDLTLTDDVTNETDGCNNTGLEATFTDTITDGSCANESTITRTWTLNDGCGNSTELVQIITIVDTTPPVITTEAQDATEECIESDNSTKSSGMSLETWLSINGGATATDNCGDVTWTNNYSELTNDCGNSGSVLVTFTATDDCGNSTNTSATYTIIDTTAPIIEMEANDLTLECNATNANDIQTWLDANAGASAFDACNDFSWSHDFSALSDDCGNTGTALVTFTVTDDCGNASTTSATVTVVDTTAPTFNETLPTDVIAECDNVPNAEVLTASDNCSDTTLTMNETITAGACDGEYTVARTWTTTDACGNTASHTQTITVQDNTVPTFNETLPTDFTAECDNVPNAEVLTASDNCGDATVTMNETITAGACDGEYTVARTWTAMDVCGNTASHTQTITVQDNTVPTFNETLPTDVTTECDNVPNAETLTATDNCGNATVTMNETITAGACDGEYTVARTWTATDACGNTATHTQTVTVQDTTAPTIDVQATDIMIECDGSGNDNAIQTWLDTNGGASASDSCSDITWTNNYGGVASDCSSAIEVIFTATDACGNSSSTTATYAIQDTTAPVIDAEANNLTVECDGTGNPIDFDTWLNNNGGASSTDDCSDISWSNNYNKFEDSCGATGSATVIFTATDSCGNSVTTTATFTIEDTTNPTFNETLPTDITTECDSVPTADILTANDTCSDAVVTLNETTTAGSCANEYTITRVWTATDACGNTITHTQTISVIDSTAPTFTVPADITIECTEDINDVSLTGDVTDEADNCDTNLEATFTDAVTDGSCANESTITRTWTLSDACGNTTELTQTISLVDNTAPTFDQDMPADIAVECDNVPTVQNITATDACGTATVTFEEETTPGSCPEDAIITRTWTAIDECGNEATHTQIITVQDTTAPTMVDDFDSEITVTCADIPEIPNLTFEDSCSSDITVEFDQVSNDDGSDNDYEIIREWTVTDSCDNVAVFTQTIFVEVESNVTGGSTDLCIGEDFDFDLFDLLSEDYATGGTWEITSGNVLLNGSIFNPYELELGTYTFVYIDDVSACPSETEVTITLNDDCVVLPCGAEDVEISKAVTANGDQWNEYFTVTGIEDCGFTIEVQIFNRWGAMIYESKNYKNDWNGFAHKSSVGGSDKVPTGTYYYIVKLNNSGLKPFSGPIYVGTK